MRQLRSVLLCITIIAIFMGACNALQCLKCNSKNHSGTCRSGKLVKTEKMSCKGDEVCYAAVEGNIFGELTFVRGCAKPQICGLKGSDESKESDHCCTCKHDLCNDKELLKKKIYSKEDSSDSSDSSRSISDTSKEHRDHGHSGHHKDGKRDSKEVEKINHIKPEAHKHYSNEHKLSIPEEGHWKIGSGEKKDKHPKPVASHEKNDKDCHKNTWKKPLPRNAGKKKGGYKKVGYKKGGHKKGGYKKGGYKKGGYKKSGYKKGGHKKGGFKG